MDNESYNGYMNEIQGMWTSPTFLSPDNTTPANNTLIEGDNSFKRASKYCLSARASRFNLRLGEMQVGLGYETIGNSCDGFMDFCLYNIRLSVVYNVSS